VDASPYDRGLATERTNLSWNRTCLALSALALLSMRLAFGQTIIAVLLAGVGVAGSMLLLAHARRRYANAAAVADPTGPAALAVLTATFGIIVIAAVLIGR
jgi:uncharacterized membrane protein YidH (DUF202 family)